MSGLLSLVQWVRNTDDGSQKPTWPRPVPRSLTAKTCVQFWAICLHLQSHPWLGNPLNPIFSSKFLYEYMTLPSQIYSIITDIYSILQFIVKNTIKSVTFKNNNLFSDSCFSFLAWFEDLDYDVNWFAWILFLCYGKYHHLILLLNDTLLYCQRFDGIFYISTVKGFFFCNQKNRSKLLRKR